MPLQEFQLTTLTYGTAPAAFLTTRALNQLILDEGNQYPLTASLIDRDFYVDDFISSCHNSSQAISIYHQLTAILLLGGFELHKWATNSTQLLEQIPTEHRAVSNVKSFDNLSDSSVQTLGLLWHVDQDIFKIQLKPLVKADRPFTKRSVLSTIAEIVVLKNDKPIVGELLLNWLTV